MKKYVGLIILVLLLSACARSAESPAAKDPLSIAELYMQAEMDNDIDTISTLLSRDVVFCQEPAGVRVQGKQAVVSLIKESMTCNHSHSIIGQPVVDGESVSAVAEVRGDDFEIMGLDHITSTYTFRINDGRIYSISSVVDNGDWARVEKYSSGGLGINIEFVEQGIYIKGFAQESPAREAGMQEGDIITCISGIGCDTMEKWETILRLRGTEGSKVCLTVVRKGLDKPMEIEVTRSRLT
jgi:limonene-1,2-epoxide hydrolase